MNRRAFTENRLAVLLAVASAAAFLLASPAQMLAALTFIAPAIVLFLLCLHGRFPGERLFTALVRAVRPRPPRMRVSRRVPISLLPRGGRLLADGLAGRAPPALRV